MSFSRTGVYPMASSFLSASSIATSLLDGEEGVTSPVMAPEGVWDTNGLFSEILDAICCAFYFSGLSMMVSGCVYVGSCGVMVNIYHCVSSSEHRLRRFPHWRCHRSACDGPIWGPLSPTFTALAPYMQPSNPSGADHSNKPVTTRNLCLAPFLETP